MTDCECPDPDIGQRIGKITQHRLKQFKEALYKKHALAALNFLMIVLYQIAQRLLKYKHQNRDPKEYRHQRISRNFMARHIKNHRQYEKTVKYQAGHSVMRKPQILQIFHLHSVRDLEQHNQDIQSHTKCNGYNKYRIKLTDKRQIGHGHRGPQPQRRKYILEAKTAGPEIAELPDADVLKIISKLAKQGTDSAAIFTEQNRSDLASEELAQVAVFQEFLPKQLSAEELAAEVKAIIAEVGASSMKEMGKVMGVASKRLAGRADGKDISAKVKELLS